MKQILDFLPDWKITIAATVVWFGNTIYDYAIIKPILFLQEIVLPQRGEEFNFWLQESKQVVGALSVILGLFYMYFHTLEKRSKYMERKSAADEARIRTDHAQIEYDLTKYASDRMIAEEMERNRED